MMFAHQHPRAGYADHFDDAVFGNRVAVERIGAPLLAVDAHQASADGLNVLAGEVTRLSTAAEGGEVSLRLMPGLQLVGFSRAGSGLQLGGTGMAAVEASAVVIAVTD